MYTVEELFCCAYAPYFLARRVQIRYPEYERINHNLYAMFAKDAIDVKTSGLWNEERY